MQWEDFLTHVLPYVKGCPDEVALDHVRKAAREFCAGTHVWNYQTEPVMSAASVTTYVLQLGDGQELVKVLAVDVDEAEYTVLRAGAGRRRARSGCSGRTAHVNTGKAEVTLNPAPWADDLAILADVVVKPSLSAEEWPDDLAEHVEDIAAGAIASLALLPGYDWSNNDLAAVQRAKFTDHIDTVGVNVSHGYGDGLGPTRARMM